MPGQWSDSKHIYTSTFKTGLHKLHTFISVLGLL